MIIHGRNFIVRAGGVAIGMSRSCTVSVTANGIKVSSPDDGEWEHVRAGRKSWSVDTGHLVTDFVESAVMVGTEVQLSMDVCGDQRRVPAFSGFVSGVTAGAIAPEAGVAVYDTTSKAFLLRTGEDAQSYQYWENWSGMERYGGADGAQYVNEVDGLLYVIRGGELLKMTLHGTALVLEWKGTFTVGNLAQGSFHFTGSGPLE